KPTGALDELEERIGATGRSFKLIVMDPLSRFAGPEAEVDNAAATALVQDFERLTQMQGKPAVLVAAHERKRGKTEDESADMTRGASALTDGARWVARLEPESKEHPARFKVVKNNYGPPMREWLHLDRL